MYNAAAMGVVGPGLAAVNSSALISAYNANSLAFSYSIAGFLMSYFIGSYAVLRELGVITNSTKIAGASSGGLLAVAHCAGIPDQMDQIFQGVSQMCRTKRNCQHILDDAVRAFLKARLPKDAYKRCSGNVWLSLTLDTFPSRHPKNILVSEFKSNHDLMEAAAASSFIPVWSGKTLTTQFRGQQAYDGFFSNPQPCPPGVKYCVKISSSNPPWERTQLKKMFDILGRVAAMGTGSKSARLADSPHGGFKSDRNNSFDGENDEAEGDRAKSDKMGKSEKAANTKLALVEGLQVALAKGVDIMPGVWDNIGMSDQSWADLLVLPGDRDIQQHLLQLGRKDAAAWAEATGLKQAAAAAAQRVPDGGGSSKHVAPSQQVAITARGSGSKPKATEAMG